MGGGVVNQSKEKATNKKENRTAVKAGRGPRPRKGHNTVELAHQTVHLSSEGGTRLEERGKTKKDHHTGRREKSKKKSSGKSRGRQ